MSWLFSQALVEEFLGENCLDGEQSAPLNGNPIQQAYCAPDKMTGFSRLSRFGMMFKPLTETLGEELLTLYLEDFHAKTLVPQDEAQGLMESDQECGEKWHASFVKFDPDSCSWKTHQCSLLGDLESFSETWPQWGLMRAGECWEQQTLERHIKGTESGLLEKTKIPTPTASMMPCEGTVRIMRKAWQSGEFSLQEASAIAGRDVRLSQGKVQAMWPTPVKSDCEMRRPTAKWTGTDLVSVVWTETGGRENPNQPPALLNATWVEWLMGWPLGWTDLKPSAMGKFHYVQQQPSES